MLEHTEFAAFSHPVPIDMKSLVQMAWKKLAKITNFCLLWLKSSENSNEGKRQQFITFGGTGAFPMMCSDTAELPTAGCVGCWTGKAGQIQGRQSHHKIQKPYIGGSCENPHTGHDLFLGSSSRVCNCPLPDTDDLEALTVPKTHSQLLQLLICSCVRAWRTQNQ